MSDTKNKKAYFTRCLQEQTKALYRMAVKLTKNDADAEDLVAEAVVKAWTAFDSLEDQSRFRPWMFRILHNCFVSHYRMKKARPAETSYSDIAPDQHGEDELISLLLAQPDDFLFWWANPERDLANKLLNKDIFNAIECLPEEYRVTVLLVNVEGLSYDDAAEVLGVPPGTVRSRMKRGRTLLQKSLWQHANEMGLITTSSLKESSK